MKYIKYLSAHKRQSVSKKTEAVRIGIFESKTAFDSDSLRYDYSETLEDDVFETYEREWRNIELEKYDLLSLLTNTPNHDGILIYKQTLRDWPSTEDFPMTRPILEIIEQTPREWRNKELLKSDHIVPITDHPQHGGYITYRQELRDWPSLETFPSASSRPTL